MTFFAATGLISFMMGFCSSFFICDPDDVSRAEEKSLPFPRLPIGALSPIKVIDSNSIYLLQKRAKKKPTDGYPWALLLSTDLKLCDFFAPGGFPSLPEPREWTVRAPPARAP